MMFSSPIDMIYENSALQDIFVKLLFIEYRLSKMGTFQQIVECITNFGYNIRYRELCSIINGFNSKGLGNNFYQSVALNPIHKWIFWGKNLIFRCL